MSEPRDPCSEHVVVRDAVEGDLAGLLELYVHLHDHDAPLPPMSQLGELWEGMVANPSLRTFVVEHEGRLVCSCNLTLIPNLTRGARPFGVVENVVTEPGARRRGLAKAVLEHALDAAWQAGCYKVMLLSDSDREAAHGLYEKVGFKRGIKVGFVAKPEEFA